VKKFNWNTVRLVLIVALMIFLYSFSGIKNKERKIQKINIAFNADDYPFLNETMVNNLLIQNFQGASKVKKEKVNLKELESLLNANKYVDNSQVFCSIDGFLNAKIKQKKPIIRVFNENGSYYLDNKGDKVPLSENFTPRVPVYYGVINANEVKQLVSLFDFIEKDEMLKHNIVDIKKTQKGNIIFSVRDYNYKVIFGTEFNMEIKFKNYKAFLQHASKDILIKSYKSVNLIFTEQVICAK
jgi:cell division protein FtsQ